jgi:hypothetical protein
MSPLIGKDQREPAVVSEARCEMHEHYRTIVGEVALRGPNEGWGQTFGQICLDPDAAKAWEAEVCALFGVKTLAECKGRTCLVLRAWPDHRWGGDIEGLEVDGRRLTLTGFRRKYFPNSEGAAGPLEQKKANLRRGIRRAARDIERWTSELETAHEGFVDWSAP